MLFFWLLQKSGVTLKITDPATKSTVTLLSDTPSCCAMFVLTLFCTVVFSVSVKAVKVTLSTLYCRSCLISDCVNVVLLTYNSITKTNFNAPTTVKPFSTYLNFKLDEQQVTFLNENIQARHSSS